MGTLKHLFTKTCFFKNITDFDGFIIAGNTDMYRVSQTSHVKHLVSSAFATPCILRVQVGLINVKEEYVLRKLAI